MSPPLVVRPADEVTWEQLRAVFGVRGAGARCFCQRYRQGPGETFAARPVEERAWRLREQTGCDAAEGDEGRGGTSGLVALDAGTPVGWCAVAPRADHAGLVRVGRVPWAGRDEDRADASVWAVTCLFTRAGHRRRGVSHALALAAVDHARRCGARAVEAYPLTGGATIDEERHVGTLATFAAAGLVEVGRPTSRRAVMLLDLR